MHTVSWPKICRGKAKGGLGIPNLHETNKAFMVKLGWRYLSRLDLLGSQILHTKYGGWAKLHGPNRPMVASKTWRSISAMSEIIRKGVPWRLGRGDHILFWKDCWLGEEPLLCTTIAPVERAALDRLVQDY